MQPERKLVAGLRPLPYTETTMGSRKWKASRGALRTAAVATVGVVVMAFLTALPGRAAPADVVEEIIAQVNDSIIRLSEYNKNLASLHAELSQGNRSTMDVEAQFRDQQKDVLRDLIDHQLLVQKAADLGLNADTEVVKRLDEIRQSMKLPSMEALEDAVTKQGMVYEDFKENIRDSILTQEVIQREVGSHIQVSPDEIKAYYDQHQKELQQPAGVTLQEILISTENKKEDEIPALRKKAEEVLAKAKKGDDFEALARQNSDDASSSNGGNVGFFEKGSLSPEIETAIAKLQKNEVSDLIDTKYGFMILKLISQAQAGIPSLADAESKINEKIYLEKIQPALREYLTTLRTESYISVKPGYVDSGAAPQQAGNH